jgi:hypothetical protein
MTTVHHIYKNDDHQLAKNVFCLLLGYQKWVLSFSLSIQLRDITVKTLQLASARNSHMSGVI